MHEPSATSLPLHEERRSWPLSWFLAATGVASILFGGWTVVAWLCARHAYQVTEFRDTHSASWTAAKAGEGIAVLVTVVSLIYLVRGCLRARGLTLDAKVVLGTLPIYWIDPLLNALQPSFFYSSNFVNVANWCGDMPLVRNAECGRLPEPVLLLWPIYTFGVYVIAKAFVAIMHRVKHRWPRMSNTELVALTLILVAMFDAGIEQAGLRFNLWAYPGYPDALSVGGGVHKLPFIEMTFIAIWVGGTACLYYFRDDRGRTIVEQGLERLSPPRRTVVEISAIHGVIASLFMVGTMLNVAAGLWSSKYPEMPAYLVNRLCDAPGVTGTDYGPCPGGTNGSREWRIPINQP